MGGPQGVGALGSERARRTLGGWEGRGYTMWMSLTADLGESFGRWRMGDDDALLEVVTSASVACGFHAGDPMVMDRTVRLASARGVGVGAHPGYRDLEGFGRRDLVMSQDEIRTAVLYQVGALAGFCRAAGISLEHVKPHGQLYNRALIDEAVARAVVAGVAGWGAGVPVVAAGGALADAARAAGLPVAVEAYVDRRYAPDGTLVPRGQPGAVLTDPAAVVAQAQSLACEGRVQAAGGAWLSVAPDTLVVHGDTLGAAGLAGLVKETLAKCGIRWGSLADVLSAR